MRFADCRLQGHHKKGCAPGGDLVGVLRETGRGAGDRKRWHAIRDFRLPPRSTPGTATGRKTLENPKMNNRREENSWGEGRQVVGQEGVATGGGRDWGQNQDRRMMMAKDRDGWNRGADRQHPGARERLSAQGPRRSSRGPTRPRPILRPHEEAEVRPASGENVPMRSASAPGRQAGTRDRYSKRVSQPRGSAAAMSADRWAARLALADGRTPRRRSGFATL